MTKDNKELKLKDWNKGFLDGLTYCVELTATWNNEDAAELILQESGMGGHILTNSKNSNRRIIILQDILDCLEPDQQEEICICTCHGNSVEGEWDICNHCYPPTEECLGGEECKCFQGRWHHSKKSTPKPPTRLEEIRAGYNYKVENPKGRHKRFEEMAAKDINFLLSKIDELAAQLKEARMKVREYNTGRHSQFLTDIEKKIMRALAKLDE